MNYTENGTKAENLKIAYVGGGSRGWARGLMSDLASEPALCGTVYLYDIDQEAAKMNEIIGKKFGQLPETKSKWKYKAVATLKEALKGADFVVVSILPGTFEEMRSDVHLPEKYGIYQSVGDTSGPGGIVRALRTIPMYKVIAEGIRDYCPDAWVINYTNPMTMCVASLYKYFPKIKAFGCCHEVFGTQRLIVAAYNKKTGANIDRSELNTNVVGINHFTWITDVHYKNEDIFGLYADFANEHYESGFLIDESTHWMNNSFACAHRVKFDLFKRYGVIAAAGDRHLAEFCPGKWYLESPEQVKEWMFGLTTVDWRVNDLNSRLALSKRLASGEEQLALRNTGEEGVMQMKAILGLSETLVTNCNMPNVGQISNLPLGFVVETNASFSSGDVKPVTAGSLPKGVDNLVQRVAYNQELTIEAAMTGNYELAFNAFVNDPLVTISMSDARKLFDQMLKNTAKYLPDYKA